MTAFSSSRLAASALAALLASAGAHAENLLVEPICACWITSLSADGSAAAGNRSSSQAVIRWTRQDGDKALGRNTANLGVGGGTPHISADGSVVSATILDSTRSIATQGRWTAAGGWQQLDQPLPPDGGVMDLQDATAFGMSGDGQVVTGLYWRPGAHDGSAHASVWKASTGMVGMPTAGGSSRIDGASFDGSVLSGWEEDSTGQRQATVWIDGVKSQIEVSEYASEASFVTGDGKTIVGYALEPALLQEEATRWTWNGSGWDKLSLGLGRGATTSGSSSAIAASDDGSIVVGMYRSKFSTFSSGGFVWTAESGLVDAGAWLRSSGVAIHTEKHEVLQVSAISADGRVLSFVVQGLLPPFQTRTYLVTRLDAAAAKAH